MKREIETKNGNENVDHLDLEKYTIVLIDVLRASSTITTLFDKDLEFLYSVRAKKEAINMKRKNKSRILIGERYGIKIKNFDYGNSPYLINKENFKGKEAVFSSSNFSKVLVKYLKASKVLVGCILNARFISDYILANDDFNKILLVKAGTGGIPSKEDELGCSIIKKYINKEKNKSRD
ncbi:MAG: hypothetical protein GF329_21645 [Candidatus Lokiarchaeota archaeon]|nr:hypothetical protein [Candidatus Lokiarchaeota archaeon]